MSQICLAINKVDVPVSFFPMERNTYENGLSTARGHVYDQKGGVAVWIMLALEEKGVILSVELRIYLII